MPQGSHSGINAIAVRVVGADTAVFLARCFRHAHFGARHANETIEGILAHFNDIAIVADNDFGFGRETAVVKRL